MELDWLRTFVAVVEQGSFHGAAQTIHRSQSRVSSHVKSLEQDLGAALFDRTRHPAVLTTFGAALLPKARAVIALVESTREDMRALSGQVRGEVHLGSYPSASAALVPRLLRLFTVRYPQVRVTVLERGSIDLDETLCNGRVDLIIRPTVPVFDDCPVEMRELWQEKIKLILPVGHPLARRHGPIHLTDVQGDQLVLAAQAGARPRTSEVREALTRSGGVYTIAMETVVPQTVVSIVRDGHAVGVANALALTTADLRGVSVHDIDDPAAVRTVAAYWRSGRALSVAARAVLDTVVTLAAQIDVAPPAGGG